MIKSDLEKKADFTFYQILSIGVGFFILFLFFVLKIYPILLLLFKSSWYRLESICSCLNHLSFGDHPFIFTFLTLASLILLAFLSFALTKIIKLKLSTDRFIRSNLVNKNKKISPILTEVIEGLGLENKIIEINNQKPIIFCFGLINPKICVSLGFIRGLSTSELKAALLHERHHLLSYEPVRIFILKITIKVLFFLPGLKYFFNQYLIFSELAADEKATNNFQDKIALAGALAKAIKWKKEVLKKNELAISFFANQVMEERVNKLADSYYQPKFRLFNPRLSLGILLLILIFVLGLGIFSVSGTVLAKQTVSQCLLKEENITSQCDISLKKTVCNMGNYGAINLSCTN
ncbi:MAG: M56 family metallopeptidase [Patescibacteria group bacterium]